MAVAGGAASVSILQPMFLKPTETELFVHFKTIAEAVPKIPVLLYNNVYLWGHLWIMFSSGSGVCPDEIFTGGV